MLVIFCNSRNEVIKKQKPHLSKKWGLIQDISPPAWLKMLTGIWPLMTFEDLFIYPRQQDYFLGFFLYFLRMSFMASSRSSFWRLPSSMARILNCLISSSSIRVLYVIFAIAENYFNFIKVSNKKLDLNNAITLISQTTENEN